MKKFLIFLITLLLFISNIKAFDIDIKSNNVYVYNLTEDKIMYEKNAYDEILVASMTKIMTAIIVIENNKDLDKEITIEDSDLRDMYEYTTTGFQEGNKVTIKELLYGILLKSGSDAVNAAVRVTTDTEEEFISLMNQKVKELGLTHTYFSNPIGKDKDNYSSVSDIGKIMEYCLKNKYFKEIISTDSFLIDSLDIQVNGPLHNSISKYNVDTSVINGAKTGFTTLARHSMVSFAEKDDITYIVVTAYAQNYKDLLNDSINIYNYLFDNYSYVDYPINFNIDIENGKQDIYNVNIDAKIYLENNYDKDLITYKYEGAKEINFLMNKNDKLGTVSVFYDKDLIKKIDVRLNDNIEYKPKAYIGVILLVLICLISGFIILKKIRIKKVKNKKVNNKKVVYTKIEKPKKEIKPIIQKKRRDIHPALDEFIKEENSISKKLDILNNTIDINLFFDTLRSLKSSDSLECDKEKFEHDFIDRCFQNIDFKNLDELRTLYTKLKLYKSCMSLKTIKYYNILFKYCTREYIDKK